jgi:cell division septal protein FtsQ
MPRDPHFLRPGRGVERSRAGRRRRVLLVFIFAFALVAGGAVLTLTTYQYLTNPESFQVRKIIIEGAEFAPQEEIADAVRQLTAGNVLLVDLKQVRSAVESHPWVAEATVRKVLPDTLQIGISERVPTACVILEGEIYLTDDSGILIDKLRPEHPFIGLPVIGGIDSLEPDKRRERIALAASMLSDLKRRRSHWYERLSEIYPEPLRRTRLRFKDMDCDFLVDAETGELVGSLGKYFDIEASIRKRYNKIDYIDLRFDRRLVVKAEAGEQGG